MAEEPAKKSLRDRAYEELRDRIVDLRLSPGQRLVERDLATELEISRIPLREALQLLEREGLVVIVPRQGAIVAPFTVTDVRDLFDVRESLEVLAARLAAGIAYRHVASGREPSLALSAQWSMPEIDPVTATRTRQRGPQREKSA
ncbi:hypothetical protein NN3_64200 [Nocardia neocaledoniensis NBRC 108232]|uniref:GntR family transcriptional regulator n=1 Tax=Nocardia neocaledoniensis TaxID=236511 RepID=UPI0011961E46|nr:GntR family transcriptional regulator [Nocardia neocaledoniensis]GEM35413.1 hypothetical protein NN3_64200 [Nocardia neocaledoniensis NBRC 108232]